MKEKQRKENKEWKLKTVIKYNFIKNIKSSFRFYCVIYNTRNSKSKPFI